MSNLDYYLDQAAEALREAHRLNGIPVRADDVDRLHAEADKWIELARLKVNSRG